VTWQKQKQKKKEKFWFEISFFCFSFEVSMQYSETRRRHTNTRTQEESNVSSKITEKKVTLCRRIHCCVIMSAFSSADAPLESSWCLWDVQQPGGVGDSESMHTTVSALAAAHDAAAPRLRATVTSLRQVWPLLAAPSSTASLALFRAGVRPALADVANQRGGVWVRTGHSPIKRRTIRAPIADRRSPIATPFSVVFCHAREKGKKKFFFSHFFFLFVRRFLASMSRRGRV
jgi:hypothetical protein